MSERWTPRIGDPTAVGWITVVAYLIVALACYDAARRCRGGGTVLRDRPFLFWTGLAAMLLALGINKQLDLQSLLTQVMRDAAKSEGWYEQRRHVQLLFIEAIGVVGALALVAIPVVLRATDRGQRIAIAGMIFLYAFILIRASSFHHVDLMLAHTVLFMKMNWIFELGGLMIVLAGARMTSRRVSETGRQPISS